MALSCFTEFLLKSTAPSTFRYQIAASRPNFAGKGGAMSASTVSGSSAIGVGVEHAEAECAASEEIMLQYRLSPATFRTLSAIPSTPDRRAILETACKATEFRSFPIKKDERAFFREINENTAIPYLVKGPVTDPWHKAFLLVQLDLLNARWPNKLPASSRKELMSERGRIYMTMKRVLRCIVDIFGQRGLGRGLSVALDVLRSVAAGVWEGMGAELMQVEGIGSVKMDRLVRAGVRNIKQLSKMEFYHIERLLSRNPPFGQQILRQLAGFPQLNLKIDVLSQYGGADNRQSVDMTSSPAQSWVTRIVMGYDNQEVPQWRGKYPWTTLVIEGSDDRLAWFWRGSVRALGGGKEIVVKLKGEPGETLKVTFCCEQVVGTMIRETIDLSIRPSINVTP